MHHPQGAHEPEDADGDAHAPGDGLLEGGAPASDRAQPHRRGAVEEVVDQGLEDGAERAQDDAEAGRIDDALGDDRRQGHVAEDIGDYRRQQREGEDDPQRPAGEPLPARVQPAVNAGSRRSRSPTQKAMNAPWARSSSRPSGTSCGRS